MATVSLLLKVSTKTPKGKPVPIYVRLQDTSRLDIMTKTKYSILPDEWNKTKQQPKSLRTDYFKNLNADLLDLKTDLLRHYNNNGNILINTAWLKSYLTPVEAVEEKPVTLIDYFTDYITDKATSINPNSIKKYNVIKNKIIRYEAFMKQPILIKNINTAFQKSFENFCIKNGYAKNTITMEMRMIKNICKRAGRGGVELSNDIDNIENSYEKTDSVFLTFEELEIIKKPKLSPYHENARNWLIVSCYTGQRVSDFMRFDKTMIREQKNKKGDTIHLIEFEQVKTGKIMTLPLNKDVMEVVDRLGGFPNVISETKYNAYIKVVCKKAGLTKKVIGAKKVQVRTEKDGTKVFRKQTGLYPKYELVSSHIGRRSFASNFYGKIPTSLLIAATGHSTEQMFLKYIGKSSSDRAMELAEWL